MSTPTTIVDRLDELYADPEFSWLLAHDGAIGFDLATIAGDVLRSDADYLTVLIGQAGDDTLMGSARAKTLMVGGAGNDTYVVRRSDHEIADSSGQDTLIVVTELAQEISQTTNAVIALDGASAPIGFGEIAYQAPTGIEHLTAIVWEGSSTASFDLLGNGNDNLLVGDSFANKVAGGEGNDQLFGHGGDDQLSGGAGADELSGGVGADSLRGDAENDRLYGGAGDDLIEGGDGDDWLEGNAGNDHLQGGDGNDTMTAASGSDRLEGGAGNDLFLIGHQADIVELNGGTGADFFAIGARAGDLVLSFEDLVLGEDTIDLSGWIGTATADSVTVSSTSEGVDITAPGRTLTLLSPVDIMDFLNIEGQFQPLIS